MCDTWSLCRYLYWTEAGVSPRISRSLLNGSHVEVLFAAGLVRPLGLTLDPLGGTMFWADPGKQTIEYSTLSGRGRGVFASGGGVWPFQLALYRGYLIWTSMGGASYHVADVRNSSVAGSLAVENILGETFPLYGLAAVNQNRRLDVSVGRYWGPVSVLRTLHGPMLAGLVINVY